MQGIDRHRHQEASMTTATITPAPPPTRADSRLGPPLGEMHRQWLQELRAKVERTKAKDRDIWARWEAVRYVDTVFSGRFDRERTAINRLADSAQLWVSAELVSNLRWQLRNSVGLCHHGTQFSILMDKLIRAVAYWFAAVEDIAGPIKWADLSHEARQDLAGLGLETAPSWSELPVSLATSL
jgi:hypothetical protein